MKWLIKIFCKFVVKTALEFGIGTCCLIKTISVTLKQTFNWRLY